MALVCSFAPRLPSITPDAGHLLLTAATAAALNVAFSHLLFRCETWCGNSSKPNAKTIDLCNNPLTKEPKLNQATRVIGDRWTQLDQRRATIEEEESGPSHGGLAKKKLGKSKSKLDDVVERVIT